MHRQRISTAALAAVVFPLLGVALFWVLAVPLFDKLDWLPGGLPLAMTLSLAPALTAFTAYRRRTRPAIAVARIAAAFVMTIVWFYGFWMLVMTLDPQPGHEWT